MVLPLTRSLAYPQDVPWARVFVCLAPFLVKLVAEKIKWQNQTSCPYKRRGLLRHL
jgi:hypothetical protein